MEMRAAVRSRVGEMEPTFTYYTPAMNGRVLIDS